MSFSQVLQISPLWEYVELLHQCKGNVINYFAQCSCVVYFIVLHVINNLFNKKTNTTMMEEFPKMMRNVYVDRVQP